MAGDKVSFNPIEKLFGNNKLNLIDNYFTAKPKYAAKTTNANYSSDWEKWMAQASEAGATTNKQ